MSTDVAWVIECSALGIQAGLSSEAQPSLTRGPPPTSRKQASEFWKELLGAADLPVSTDGRPVVLSIPLATPQRTREELCELAFEHLNARSVYIGSSPFFSTMGAGLSSALVLEVGETGSMAVLVDDGFPLVSCATGGGAGGQLLTTAMAALLRECDGAATPDLLPAPLAGSAWETCGRLAKEQVGYVALDFLEETQKLHSGLLAPQICTLPTGELSLLKGEGFRSTELLFDPSACQLPALEMNTIVPLHELVMGALRLESNVNVRGRMLDAVLLVGSSSLLPGLPERLSREVRLRGQWVAPGKKREEVHVLAPAGREILAWTGASQLAECDVFRQMVTTKDEYTSEGVSIVHENFL